MIAEHKNAGKLKIVFIKTTDKLIPIISTDLTLEDKEMIEVYKRFWDMHKEAKSLESTSGFKKRRIEFMKYS